MTLKRDDFVFTIGYQGDAAIVDRAAKRRYAQNSADQLLSAGLYRQALCAAMFDGELERFVNRFAAASGVPVANEMSLKRLFGVFEVPQTVQKVVAIQT